MSDPSDAPTGPFLKGRGAQYNPANPYHRFAYETDPGFVEDQATTYIEVHPKTILNKVNSPDIGFEYSLNPYQGCEHGCIYCYARLTHAYWGYSAGLDFESKILVKSAAPALLEEALRKPGMEHVPIMLAGNTDIYQPAERKFGITRKILEVLLKYRFPAGMLTKNNLILRDLDLLKELSARNLIRTGISLTTLDDTLRRFLEPRATSIRLRLETIRILASEGIPVFVMLAPIIPGLNEHEILPMAEKAAELGAYGIGYSVVRLNGEIGPLFEDWIRKTYPDRADKVLQKIRGCHNGSLEDKRFGKRMTGEGKIPEIIRQQFELAKRLYFKDKIKPEYDFSAYQKRINPQLDLFSE